MRCNLGNKNAFAACMLPVERMTLPPCAAPVTLRNAAPLHYQIDSLFAGSTLGHYNALT